jgi:drug/metabolite transporter (DMT)-like permease
VPLSVQLGVVLALVTALMSIVGFLLKHRGAVAAPDVQWRRPVRSTIDLFRSRIYVIGCVVATTSWGFHVAALALAPISIVQSVIAGGLVMLTFVADRVFGQQVTRREWIGVALTAAGLAFLAATLGDTGDSAHADYELGTLAGYVGLATVAGLALVSLARLRPRDGILLAVSAGLLWGGSDVTIKALSDHLGADGVGVMLNPLALVILVLSIVGMVVSARSLQVGEAVPVIAATSAAANLTTIASGLVVFGEPLPDGALAVIARLGAFALVVVAAFLTPAPTPAAEP